MGRYVCPLNTTPLLAFPRYFYLFSLLLSACVSIPTLSLFLYRRSLPRSWEASSLSLYISPSLIPAKRVNKTYTPSPPLPPIVPPLYIS